MKKFPNKMIREAYESALGKVFTQSTADLSFTDQHGNKNYNHHALQWLYDQGIIQRELNYDRFVFEYKVVK